MYAWFLFTKKQRQHQNRYLVPISIQWHHRGILSETIFSRDCPPHMFLYFKKTAIVKVTGFKALRMLLMVHHTCVYIFGDKTRTKDMSIGMRQ